MKKNAFSMLELVFVIVVLGILAALAMPRMERDVRQDAADSILAAIRYTQHLALSDNVTEPSNPNWQRKFWRFGVRTCTGTDLFYYIGSDKSAEGNIDANEAAIDLSNGDKFWASAGTACSDGTQSSGTSKSSTNIFISHLYGINDNNSKMFQNCRISNSSTARYVGFDYLGRPHVGFNTSSTPDYSTLLTSDCNLTFQFDDGSADLIINIQKETGYASIVGQNAS